MKDWIRNLFGLTDLQNSFATLAKSLSEQKIHQDFFLNEAEEKLSGLLEQVNIVIPSSLTSLQENIVGLNTEILKRDQKQNLILIQSDKILSEVNDKISTLLPKVSTTPKLENFHLDLNKKIKFQRIDLSRINRQELIPVSQNEANSGVLSNLMSGAIYGETVNYTAEGLYKASTTVSDLVRYSDGSYASISTQGGKFSSHHGFNPSGAAALWPVLVLQLATIITSQQHMQEIGKQLIEIKGKLNDLAVFNKNERIAQLQYINERLEVYQNRKHFTIEDFVLFESFKYDLAKIKGECVMYYGKKMRELTVKYGLSNSLNIQDHSDCDEGMIKKFRSVAKNFGFATKVFFKNSSGNIKEFIKDFRDADLFA